MTAYDLLLKDELSPDEYGLLVDRGLIGLYMRRPKPKERKNQKDVSLLRALLWVVAWFYLGSKNSAINYLFMLVLTYEFAYFNLKNERYELRTFAWYNDVKLHKYEHGIEL